MSKLKPFFYALVGVLSTLGVLSLSHVGPASAQSPGVNLAALVAQVNSLQSTVTSQSNTITSQAAAISSLQSKQSSDEKTIASQGSTTNTQTSQISVLQQDDAGFKTMLANLNTSVGSLQTKTAPLSLSSDPNVGGTNTLLTIKGVNVQIVDGSGVTYNTSGLGNLIIGYNKTGNDLGSGDVRTGSHNLILGDENNYSSYGGLVAGEDNAISGSYASVSGGNRNAANVSCTSVSGGFNNTAGAFYASVSGGGFNTASGSFASVSGGQGLTQSNAYGWTGGSYHSP